MKYKISIQMVLEKFEGVRWLCRWRGVGGVQRVECPGVGRGGGAAGGAAAEQKTTAPETSTPWTPAGAASQGAPLSVVSEQTYVFGFCTLSSCPPPRLGRGRHHRTTQGVATGHSHNSSPPGLKVRISDGQSDTTLSLFKGRALQHTLRVPRSIFGGQWRKSSNARWPQALSSSADAHACACQNTAARETWISI